MFFEEEDEEYESSGRGGSRGGGVYRVRDNISNFRIRVRVRKIQSPLYCEEDIIREDYIGESSSESIKSDEREENEEEDANGASGEKLEEEVSLGWQQKLFSKDEISKFKDSKETDYGDDKVLFKKFYHDVQKIIKEKNPSRSRIFTTVDGEISKRDEILIQETPILCDKRISDEIEPNYLTCMMADGVRRRLHQTIIPSDDNSLGSSIVIPKPSRETKIRLHTTNIGSHESMSIRFDLSDDGGDYVELCLIKLSLDNVLEVLPDFTHNNKPYKIQVSGKFLYEYWVLHDSNDINYEDQLRETLLMNQVLKHRMSTVASEVGKEFESPWNEESDRMFRLFVNGEIVSAKNYDYDNLFIHYFMDSPMGWTTTIGDYAAHGLTLTSKTNSKNEAYFCTTFNSDLCFDINRLDYYDTCSWPMLFVEVLSIDSWTRLRTEGYGFISLPYLPGCYNLKIETWRPLMTNPHAARIAEMRRYFIGGTPELEDLSSSIGNVTGTVLSRYGSKTVSTGSVQVRINTIHHSPKAFLPKKKTCKHWKNQKLLLDRLASASLFHSVSSVIAEFGKARERIIKASEGFEFNGSQAKDVEE